MKTLSRKELVAKAAAIFKGRTETTLFATSDGQFFIFKDRANMHANFNRKSPLKVYEIDRSEVEEELDTESSKNEDEGYTVRELETLVSETSDKAVLEGFLEDEKTGKNRKTAIAAIVERLKELAPGDDNEPNTDE